MKTQLFLAERDGRFGKVHLLVDQHGDVIPGQIESHVSHGADQLSQLSVTFYLHQNFIRVGDPCDPVSQHIDRLVAEAKSEIALMTKAAHARLAA